ncbi:MAG TPA: selenocysteine-specific translation elongation factor [Burkholderiaceae bacterium]|jgi:selenocysteine-specific elongation factor|nr:selenocysteine-specific translation elongation factor [Burkholderiaceae bacterium]
MIVGTAGHVDHGKTTLVRALTGVDTDRLKEEKARGISIELGYAYTPLPGGGVLGVVDVPGHERFVHTMAAGAAGLDHALLVVAADDGVMPQTREHLAIVQLLGVRCVTPVLTKIDRVPGERVAQVRAEVAALVDAAGLAREASFETAATHAGDAGVAALRAHLEALALAHPPRAHDGPFRLAIDRVFTLAGQGTIVTGAVFGGRVAVGDVLRHSASGEAVRVRGLHAQGRVADEGVSGQRCALQLAGIERAAIARGDWILADALCEPVRRVDVRLRLLPGAPPLAMWAPLHVHLGAAHCMAHAVPLDAERVASGAEARVQLVFDEPVFALAGDRFVARNAQASATIGGGVVLDPCAPERRRRSRERAAWLDALEGVQAGGAIAALVAASPAGLARSRLALLLGPTRAGTHGGAGVRELPLAQDDVLLLSDAAWETAARQVLDALERFHAASPDEPGVNAARLRRMAGLTSDGGAGDALWRGVLDALLRDGAVAAGGAWLHLPSHASALSAEDEALAARLLARLSSGPVDPPWVRELAAREGLPEERVRALMRRLARQGRAWQVVKDLFFAPSALQSLAATLAGLASTAGRAGVRAVAFKEATGLGRKRAIQVLEFLDRTGVTRRIGDARIVIAEPAFDAPREPAARP